ncbi:MULTISPECIES: GNAT family N-acetyltransferase [Lysinibacillus]|uniref:GNAT family N-acetyltransferase n=1 Tax=Lysinibacillus TaxID=400634 RepID=UPI0009F6DE0C
MNWLCGLGPDDVKGSEIEIYYGISQTSRGQGIAYEAANALMNYVFYKIGLLKIIAVVILKTLHLSEF